MARHANSNWNLPENSGTPHYHEWNSIICALLMDLRDEMRVLNRTLQCKNFQAIPARLLRVARNTDRQMKKKARP